MPRAELKDRKDVNPEEGASPADGVEVVDGPAGGAKPPARGRGNSPLERVTVNLNTRSAAALERAAAVTGDTKTDTINRALQLYAMLVEVVDQGGAVYIREEQGGELERQRFFYAGAGSSDLGG